MELCLSLKPWWWGSGGHVLFAIWVDDTDYQAFAYGDFDTVCQQIGPSLAWVSSEAPLGQKVDLKWFSWVLIEGGTGGG